MTITDAIKTASRIKAAKSSDIQAARVMLLDEVANCFNGTHDDQTGTDIIDALNILTDKSLMASKLTNGQRAAMDTLAAAGSILWQWDGEACRSKCTHKVNVSALAKLVQLGLATEEHNRIGKTDTRIYRAA